MKTRLRDNFVGRLCRDAILTAAALILSYLESVLPLGLLIPLPGVKPGLANIAVTLAFFGISPADAAVISALRVCVSGLLFGSPVSFAFSAAGALLAYAGLLIAKPLMTRKKLSFVGCSVICAALNGAGQLAAAAVIYTPAAFSYYPVMLAAGTVTGTLSGFLINLIYPKTERILNVGN